MLEGIIVGLVVAQIATIAVLLRERRERAARQDKARTALERVQTEIASVHEDVHRTVGDQLAIDASFARLGTDISALVADVDRRLTQATMSQQAAQQQAKEWTHAMFEQVSQDVLLELRPDHHGGQPHNTKHVPAWVQQERDHNLFKCDVGNCEAKMLIRWLPPQHEDEP